MFNGLPALGGYPDVSGPRTAILNDPTASTQSGSTFTVGWWGQDFESGIGGFNVDVSDNGSVWIRWLDATAPAGSSRPRRAATSRSSASRVTRTPSASRRLTTPATRSSWSATKATTVSGSAARTTQLTGAYGMGRGGESRPVEPPMVSPAWPGAYVRGFGCGGRAAARSRPLRRHLAGRWRANRRPDRLLPRLGHRAAASRSTPTVRAATSSTASAASGPSETRPSSRPSATSAGTSRDIVLLPTSTASNPGLRDGRLGRVAPVRSHPRSRKAGTGRAGTSPGT